MNNFTNQDLISIGLTTESQREYLRGLNRLIDVVVNNNSNELHGGNMHSVASQANHGRLTVEGSNPSSFTDLERRAQHKEIFGEGDL